MKAKKIKKRAEKTALFHLGIGYARSTGSMGGISSAAGEGADEISGDTAVSCNLADGIQAFILSDGMGKGAPAASESRFAVYLLRRLLKQGTTVAGAIKEVNRRLLEKDRNRGKEAAKESFATVDLVLVNRVTGRGSFYKMGAAPSYVIRGAKVRKVEQPALPVGIIPVLKLTHVTAKLSRGDILVMISDGILDSDREDAGGDWLISLLRDAGVSGKYGPRQLAVCILEEAHKRYGQREMDDATVVVAVLR